MSLIISLIWLVRPIRRESSVCVCALGIEIVILAAPAPVVPVRGGDLQNLDTGVRKIA